ncbi:MAG: VOC family protein [Novosphingobium sp.]
MAQLNHTIVWCSDKQRSADFLCPVLGAPPAQTFSHFLIGGLGNDVSLDFMEHAGPIVRQHYAFLVSDAEFDAGFALIRECGLTYWADPACKKPGEINYHWQGRGFYFEDPDGHLLELITKPYGDPEHL